jgi:hypothetical protein
VEVELTLRRFTAAHGRRGLIAGYGAGPLGTGVQALAYCRYQGALNAEPLVHALILKFLKLAGY